MIPPPATVTVRPTFNYANLDSADNSEDEDNDIDNEEASENATAVTRFLIKHLPKQLAKLRNDKAEMEEKLRDLETVISNQNLSMSEMERRIDVYKKEAETSRKWSFSLANLHQIKASSNTTSGTTKTKPRDCHAVATTLREMTEKMPHKQWIWQKTGWRSQSY